MIWIQPAFSPLLIIIVHPSNCIYWVTVYSVTQIHHTPPTWLQIYIQAATFVILSSHYTTSPEKNDLFFISQLMSVPLFSLLWPSFFTQDVKYTCYVLFVIALYYSLFVSYPILILLFNFKSREKLQWFTLFILTN